MVEPEGGLRVELQGVALVGTIDRPGSRNALSTATAKALVRFAQRASLDHHVRGAIITGAGERVFVAGGDLGEFSGLLAKEEGAGEVLAMGEAPEALERCEVPVLAAVQGSAYGGGCELLLACDMVILEDHAALFFRQGAMGLSTGWGGGTRLLERVGPLVASRLLLLGEAIPAALALDLGLVSEVVPRGTALGRAMELVEGMARQPRAALAGMKGMLGEVRRARRGAALEREAEAFAGLWGGPDHRAAMEAFLRGKGR